MEGLTIMLGVLHHLVIHLYNAKHLLFKQPTCCYTPTWWPNLPGCWQKIEIFSWSEAWNLPTCGCKSMMEGLTIMLGVFMTLLYTYTMPNIYYCSNNYMLLYPHLMAKLAWELAENRDFFPDLRHETCQHGAVKVWWRALQSCWECYITLLYTHTMPNIYYCSNLHAVIPPLDGQTCLRVGRKSRFFPDLRHETCQHGAVKVWWRALQSCWECSSPCYTPIQCQTSTIVATYMLLYPHLMAKLAWELAENRDFFLIWGMKPANMGL